MEATIAYYWLSQIPTTHQRGTEIDHYRQTCTPTACSDVGRGYSTMPWRIVLDELAPSVGTPSIFLAKWTRKRRRYRLESNIIDTRYTQMSALISGVCRGLMFHDNDVYMAPFNTESRIGKKREKKVSKPYNQASQVKRHRILLIKVIIQQSCSYSYGGPSYSKKSNTASTSS